MKPIDILDHFVSQADWVDSESTVDRIIIGDPDKEVTRVLVSWISSFLAVRKAVEGGFDLLITHEPTFYDHPDHRGEEEKIEATEAGARKKRYIEDNALTILRNHDVWDRFPKLGIPWAWGSFLALGDEPTAISESRYMHRYDIDPISVDELAAKVAARTATIGEPFVQVIADGSKIVQRIGIGTGAICRLNEFEEIGCDLSIVTDDGSCYWKGLQLAADREHPVIRVNHATSEEPGMVTLTQYINDNIPSLTAEHLPHGSCFRLVGA